MPHALAQAVEVVTTVLTVAGMGYFLAALLAARVFLFQRRASLPPFAPGVSILKSLKGLDPGMMDAFRSHCTQEYAGEYELLFGISSPDDPAAAAVVRAPVRVPRASHPADRVPAAAGKQRQGQHTDAACAPCALRIPAHQRFRYHRFAALPGTGDGPPCARQAEDRLSDRALSRAGSRHAAVAAGSAGNRHGFSAQRAAGALDGRRPAVRAGIDPGRQPRSAGQHRGIGRRGGSPGRRLRTGRAHFQGGVQDCAHPGSGGDQRSRVHVAGISRSPVALVPHGA